MPDFFDLPEDVNETVEDYESRKSGKYYKDPFFGQIEANLSEDAANAWLDWLEINCMNFKRNYEFGFIGSLEKPSPLPKLEWSSDLDKTIIQKAKDADKIARKRKEARKKEFVEICKDFLAGLSQEQLSDHRWSNPDYKSNYNPKTRKVKGFKFGT